MHSVIAWVALFAAFNTSFVFLPFTQFIYSFTGYNHVFGHNHLTKYCLNDIHTAAFIRKLRFLYGLKSPCEGVIYSLSCY